MNTFLDLPMRSDPEWDHLKKMDGPVSGTILWEKMAGPIGDVRDTQQHSLGDDMSIDIFEAIQQEAEIERLVRNEIRRVCRNPAATISAPLIADNIIERKAPDFTYEDLTSVAADMLHRRWGL